MWSLGFLAKEDGIPEFNEIREMSEKEFQELSESLEDLYMIDEKIALFHMIYINYNDFQDYIFHIIQTLHSPEFRESKVKTHVNNLNCKLNNFALSIKLFLEHAERKLKNEYGKDSPEFDLFKSETSGLYDNYFSYRFLYHLRNYIQHRNVAIGILEIYEDEEKIEVLVGLNRDDLLSDYGWKRDVRTDLQEQPEVIEIFSLMGEMLNNLKSLTRILIKDELEKMNRSVTCINDLINEAENGFPVIMEYCENGVEYSDFPIDLMAFIDYILTDDGD